MSRHNTQGNYSNPVPNIGCAALLARYAFAGALAVGTLGMVAKGCVDTTRTLVAKVMDTPEKEG